ncbi:hypothetical protein NMY22_g2074 [Coprinellus aureogranulatus]|nr:hypothetical protein NMY22_g2074 [Coprinellus aureogranulatus]
MNSLFSLDTPAAPPEAPTTVQNSFRESALNNEYIPQPPPFKRNGEILDLGLKRLKAQTKAKQKKSARERKMRAKGNESRPHRCTCGGFRPAADEAPAGMSKHEKVKFTLDQCRARHISPFDIFLALLDPDEGCYSPYRVEFYKEGSQKMYLILDKILESEHGRKKLQTWFKTHTQAQDLILDIVSDEMDGLRDKAILSGVAAVGPEYIRSRSEPDYAKEAPVTTAFIIRAAQTERAKAKNVQKTPDKLSGIVMKQFMYQRSGRCIGFATEFGLFLWASGCSKQTIEALHRCGLSISYSAVLNALETLSDHCIRRAIMYSLGPHAFCYDNLNIKTSIFVEQRGIGTPSKVTSGTLGMIYRLRGVLREDMKLAPILKRLHDPKLNQGLDFNKDLVLTDEKASDISHQLKVIIVNVLLKYVKGFENRGKLEHKHIRKLPSDHVAEFQLLRVSTTEEASTQGNAQFWEECYVDQLGRNPSELSEYAIPSINDQLTNSRIRSVQHIRKKDVSPWYQGMVFQVGPGLFHTGMNLDWEILDNHRGSLSQVGSLSYWFAVLGKTRLSGEKPDYHTLLSAMRQIHDGLILNGWRIVISELPEPSDPSAPKIKTLTAYAKSNPSTEDLMSKAGEILERFATPLPAPFVPETAPEPSATNANNAPLPPLEPWSDLDPADDKVYQNEVTLLRDLLYFFEMIQAVKDFDFGRIEAMLPLLVMMFRGGGGNNYCHELLYLILFLNYIWPPTFANVMRDIMIVNVSGNEGRGMAPDLNMEHGIGETKETIILKGLESTWDLLYKTSACVNEMKEIKEKFAQTMDLPYQSKTHRDVDTSELVWRVANKAREENLQVFTPKREGNQDAKAVKDVLGEGMKVLKSSTLTTFNKKWKSFVDGHSFKPDEEDLPELDSAGTLPPVGIVYGQEQVDEEDVENAEPNTSM